MRYGKFALILCLVLVTLLGAGRKARAAVCATEQDRLVRSREKMLPDTPPADLKDLLRWLVDSSRRCATSGDLWYYRGLVERQLGQDASFSLGKAKDYKSDALVTAFNPFEKPKPDAKPFPPHVHDRYALVVGVNKFKAAGAAGSELSVGNLNFSVQDATDFAEALIARAGFKRENVTVLKDEQATLIGIRSAFADIREKANEDDLVVMYFSSHGLPHDYDPTGVSYVMVHDTDLSSQKQRFLTSLPMVELAEDSRMVRAKRFVLLLDTCYSGAAANPDALGRGVTLRTGIKAFTGALDGMQYGGAHIVLSASKADEESFEDPAIHHGFFTYYLLKTLDQAQYTSPLGTVFTTVQKSVSDAVANQVHHNQHPVVDQNAGGEKIQLAEVIPNTTAANTPPKTAEKHPGKHRGGRVIIVGDLKGIPACDAGMLCLQPGSLEKKNSTLSELELPDGKLDNWGYGYVLLSRGVETKELCPETDACSVDVICGPKSQKITVQIAADRGQVKFDLPRNQFAEKFAGEVFESKQPMTMQTVHSSQLDDPIKVESGAKIEIYYSRD
jgi:hypothetical protein